MELGSIVAYEQLYTLHLKHPATGEDTGVTFKIRSASSEEAKKVLLRHVNENYERQIMAQPTSAETRLREELEKAASYIESWDWGVDKDGQPNKINGETPELTMEKAIAILEKQGWIFGQVTRAANNIANFTPASAR
jgi:hypothetical protein